MLILDCARYIFAREGFEKTTIRAVAQRAGLGTGTIFNYFPNKQALLVASLLDDVNKIKTRALAKLPANAPIKDKLLLLSRAFYEYYARNPALSRTLIRESMFVTVKWGEPAIQDMINFLELIDKMLLNAQARGELDPDVNCRVASRSFFANYLFILVEALHEDDLKPDEMIHELAHLLEQMWSGIGRVDTSAGI